jgi:hypothetical protein
LREVSIEVEKAHDRPNQKLQRIVSQSGAYDHFPSVASAYLKINVFSPEFGIS